jgi:hypothetical protein
MRQAVRYLPEYRAIRQRSDSFLDLCFNPKLLKRFSVGSEPRHASTTLADLLTPLLVAKPFAAVRALLRRWSSEEV